jgi:lipoprotein-anchoring transpeptidase ErfK/SrfK
MRRPRLLFIGAAAAIAVAASIALPLTLSGGGSPAKRAAPATQRMPKHRVAQSHKAVVTKKRPTPARRHVAPKPVTPKHGTPKRPRVHHHIARSHKVKRVEVHRRVPIGHRQGGTWVPWRTDGTSLVAGARGRQLAVYSEPGGQRPMLVLRNPDPIGTPRVMLVHSQQQKWVRVYLPVRPNGAKGWVQANAVRVLQNPYRIVVSLGAHRLSLFRGTELVLTASTVVGRPSLPTPRGMYYIVDLLKPPDPNGAYGPFTFDLSAHSNVLKTFEGGDGHVAIHGTNQPYLLGQSVSHGCIRVSNAVIRKLAHVLPLGTPVLIRS